MKNTIFVKIIFLFFLLCGRTTAQNCSGPQCNDDCGCTVTFVTCPSTPHVLLFVWLDSPNYWSVLLEAGDDGKVSYCFPHCDTRHFMQIASDIGCGTTPNCTHYFVPVNLSIDSVRIDCEPECYCENKDSKISLSTNENNISTGKYSLQQNFPNPFNPSTTITFELPKTENVKLTVYDVSGREIMRLINGTYESGRHNLTFNGEHLSSGIYLYKLETAEFTEIKKMLLIK